MNNKQNMWSWILLDLLSQWSTSWVTSYSQRNCLTLYRKWMHCWVKVAEAYWNELHRRNRNQEQQQQNKAHSLTESGQKTFATLVTSCPCQMELASRCESEKYLEVHPHLNISNAVRAVITDGKCRRWFG